MMLLFDLAVKRAQDVFLLLAVLSLIVLLFARFEGADNRPEPSPQAPPEDDTTMLAEHDAHELARIADEMDRGDAKAARHRLERLLDDVEPGWRLL